MRLTCASLICRVAGMLAFSRRPISSCSLMRLSSASCRCFRVRNRGDPDPPAVSCATDVPLGDCRWEMGTSPVTAAPAAITCSRRDTCSSKIDVAVVLAPSVVHARLAASASAS